MLTVVVALGVAVLPITAVGSADLYAISASATGLLVAAYGLGNLTGALAVMVRPLAGDADQLTRRLAVVVAAGLAVVLVAPAFAVALVAYAATGVANAYSLRLHTRSTQRIRPPQARGQVFVWVGALKITAGSAGTALAGAAIAAGPLTPVAAAAAGIALTATLALLNARR